MATGGEPGVSPRGPASKRDARRCLPSRGARGSRFPTCPGTRRRDDSPLPLAGRFARRSLPDTAPAARRAWCPPRAQALGAAPTARPGLGSPGPLLREWGPETGGAPTFPSSPSAARPRSQPPGVSGALAAVAPRLVAVRRLPTVGFCLAAAAAILVTTTRHIAGLTDAASLLAPSRFVRPLLGWHAACTPARRARRSSGGTGTYPSAPTGEHSTLANQAANGTL